MNNIRYIIGNYIDSPLRNMDHTKISDMAIQISKKT